MSGDSTWYMYHVLSENSSFPTTKVSKWVTHVLSSSLTLSNAFLASLTFRSSLQGTVHVYTRVRDNNIMSWVNVCAWGVCVCECAVIIIVSVGTLSLMATSHCLRNEDACWCTGWLPEACGLSSPLTYPERNDLSELCTLRWAWSNKICQWTKEQRTLTLKHGYPTLHYLHLEMSNKS